MSRKRSEEEVYENESSEQSFDHVRAVAHKFNNILGVILGHSELIRMDDSESNRVNHRAKKISAAANRGHELAERLLAFGGGEASPVSVNLAKIIVPKLHRFRDRFGDNVKLVESVGETPNVLVDPEQLLQALGEMLANGRDFAEDGVLLVTVTEEPLPESVLIAPTVEAKRWLRLRVEDSGVGFEGKAAISLFEPYFSTRAKGLGLGLAAVHRIVLANGIGLDASGDYGGVFDLFLPIVSGITESSAIPKNQEQLEVWIVEDEEALLEFMQESLEMEGYIVRAFASPTELLEVLQPSAEEQPDLLLLDVALPEMSGPELLEEIHQRGWRPKVLWSSGYRANARLTENDNNHSFLQKPYAPGDLVDAVRKAT